MLKDATARSAKSKETSYDIPNGLVASLSLRVAPSGNKTWSLRSLRRALHPDLSRRISAERSCGGT